MHLLCLPGSVLCPQRQVSIYLGLTLGHKSLKRLELSPNCYFFPSILHSKSNLLYYS